MAPLTLPDGSPILMSGWLLSRSKVLKAWRWRWLALTHSELIVCKVEDVHKPKRLINLAKCSRVVPGHLGTRKENAFCMSVADISELFAARSPEERKSWMDHINKAVHRVQKPMQGVLKHRLISVSSSCSTQDSLGSHSISSCGRSFASASICPDSIGGDSELCKRLLKDHDNSARCRAASALASSHGARPPPAVAALTLTHALQADVCPAVRAAAATAIGKLELSALTGPSLDEAGSADGLAALVGALAGALEMDSDPEVRVAAAEALGQIGPAAATVVSASLPFALVTDKAPAVRSAAALAIGQAGLLAFPGGEAVLLGRLCADSSSEVRLAAVDGLTSLGPAVLARSVPKLGQALHQEKHDAVRARIADALRRVEGSANPAAAEVLRAASVSQELALPQPADQPLSRESFTEIVD